MKVAQSCLTLCDPVDCSLPGSSVHGDSPGKNTGLPCPPPGDLLNPGIKARSPTLQADSLLSEPPWKPRFEERVIFKDPPEDTEKTWASWRVGSSLLAKRREARTEWSCLWHSYPANHLSYLISFKNYNSGLPWWSRG